MGAEPEASSEIGSVTSADEVGSMFLISTGPASGMTDQWDPVAAFDGTNYLVLWTDGYIDDYDIRGARVSATGTVLDSDGISISSAGSDKLYPAVAFNGTNYFVAWEEGSYICGSCYVDVYGARVDPSGEVLDTPRIVISTVADCQGGPAVASDGTDFLVAWHDDRGGSLDIRGARISAEGVVLDTAGIAISIAAGYQMFPAIAFDGTNYFVVWGDGRSGSWDIYGARVSPSGVVLDTAGIAISAAPGNQMNPGVAFDGMNYLVVWEDGRSDFPDVYAARVSAGGIVLDAAGIAVSPASGPKMSPAIAFDGTNYVLVWQDGRRSSDMYGARVSPSGVVLDTTGIAISRDSTSSGEQMAPAIASGRVCASLVAYSSSPSSYLDWPPSPWFNHSHIWGNIWKARRGAAFASASAIAHAGYVSISWQTTVDVSEYSFVIERSESQEGEFTAIDVPVSKGADFSFSCTDYSVSRGKTYWYKIVLANSFCEKSPVSIEMQVEPLPAAYRVYQSYPNPFSPLCTIRYEITWPCKVTLRVFDLGGSLVRTLVDAWQDAGVYAEAWDGRGNDGKKLPSGVYFYRLDTGDILEAGHFVATRKLVLLR